jgi:hypothetical protein
VGNSLLRTLRRSTMGLKTRNRGPGRHLSGKDRVKASFLLPPVYIPFSRGTPTLNQKNWLDFSVLDCPKVFFIRYNSPDEQAVPV